MMITPAKALLMCDLENLSTSDCNTLTDDGSTQLWTSDFAYETTVSDQTLFNRIITYKGNNDLVEVDINIGSPTHQYFCVK